MSAASNGRVLRIALAGSLAVHLIVAAIVHSRPVAAAPQQQPHRFDIIKIRMPAPTPTPPPPRPALPHPQHKSTAVRPPMHSVRLADSNTHGRHIVAPPVEPTGDPGPAQTSGPGIAPTSGPVVTPTPKPACSAPDVPAKTVMTVTPNTPDDMSSQGVVGTAKVKVDLDPTGAVVGTSIYESTGYMELDQAALAAARQSRYTPEQLDCKNVSGSYLFTVDFQ